MLWLTNSTVRPRFGRLLHLAQALALKLGVADRQHLVDDQDLRLQVRGHRERQPHVHAARVALDRRVDEPLDPGELDDLVELRLDLAPAHAEDRAVEEDVLAARSARGESRCRPRAASRRARASTIRPSVGAVIRESIFSSVLLPAPLRPIRPTTSPRSISSDTSRSAHRSRGRLRARRSRWLRLTAGVACASRVTVHSAMRCSRSDSSVALCTGHRAGSSCRHDSTLMLAHPWRSSDDVGEAAARRAGSKRAGHDEQQMLAAIGIRRSHPGQSAVGKQHPAIRLEHPDERVDRVDRLHRRGHEVERIGDRADEQPERGSGTGSRGGRRGIARSAPTATARFRVAVVSASTTSRGIRKIWIGGTIPYTNSVSSTTTNATQKSISGRAHGRQGDDHPREVHL